MGRLCERPGCSEPASVAYGMRAEDLVFWLDALHADDGASSGVLCRRHADSMVVPRYWTLDDLREPTPRLFRSASALPPPTPVPRRRSPSAGSSSEQLLLLTDEVPAEAPQVAAPTTVPDAAVPWTPTFDEHDDLDGLLSARSPLLARAFRGDDRRRPS
jgi:hypothetical protein